MAAELPELYSNEMVPEVKAVSTILGLYFIDSFLSLKSRNHLKQLTQNSVILVQSLALYLSNGHVDQSKPL